MRLRWSVGPWAALGEDAVGTGVRTGEATSTGVLRHGGTRVRGGIRREGAKRNGAMNRGRGGRATGAYCAPPRSAARIDTVAGLAWAPSFIHLLSSLCRPLCHFISQCPLPPSVPMTMCRAASAFCPAIWDSRCGMFTRRCHPAERGFVRLVLARLIRSTLEYQGGSHELMFEAARFFVGEHICLVLSWCDKHSNHTVITHRAWLAGWMYPGSPRLPLASHEKSGCHPDHAMRCPWVGSKRQMDSSGGRLSSCHTHTQR